MNPSDALKTSSCVPMRPNCGAGTLPVLMDNKSNPLLRAPAPSTWNTWERNLSVFNVSDGLNSGVCETPEGQGATNHRGPEDKQAMPRSNWKAQNEKEQQAAEEYARELLARVVTLEGG